MQHVNITPDQDDLTAGAQITYDSLSRPALTSFHKHNTKRTNLQKPSRDNDLGCRQQLLATTSVTDVISISIRLSLIWWTRTLRGLKLNEALRSYKNSQGKRAISVILKLIYLTNKCWTVQKHRAVAQKTVWLLLPYKDYQEGKNTFFQDWLVCN